MDGVHMRLTRIFPSMAEIRADAELRFPEREGLNVQQVRDHYVRAMCEVLYTETRLMVLEADERAARKYDPPDDEDDTEDVDYGGEGRAPNADPEAVFPAAAAAPTLATDVTRREVKVCGRSA